MAAAADSALSAYNYNLILAARCSLLLDKIINIYDSTLRPLISEEKLSSIPEELKIGLLAVDAAAIRYKELLEANDDAVSPSTQIMALEKECRTFKSCSILISDSIFELDKLYNSDGIRDSNQVRTALQRCAMRLEKLHFELPDPKESRLYISFATQLIRASQRSSPIQRPTRSELEASAAMIAMKRKTSRRAELVDTSARKGDEDNKNMMNKAKRRRAAASAKP